MNVQDIVLGLFLRHIYQLLFCMFQSYLPIYVYNVRLVNYTPLVADYNGNFLTPESF